MKIFSLGDHNLQKLKSHLLECEKLRFYYINFLKLAFVVVLNSTRKGSKRGLTPNLTMEEKRIVCCNSLKFSEQKFKRFFWGKIYKVGFQIL